MGSVSPITLTTALREVAWLGSERVQGVTFKNGSASGTLYLRNRQQNLTTVSSTNYDHSLGAGESFGLTRRNDGDITGPWDAIASATVLLEICETYVLKEENEE